MLLRNIVKVQPLAIAAGNDALCAQDNAVLAAVQFGQNGAQCVLAEGAGSLHAPAGEHLISVMMVMIVVVMSAGAVLAVLVMMMVVMLVTAAAVPIMVMMLVLVVVTAAAIMMLMVLMTAAAIMMLMVLMTATAIMMLVVLMTATAIMMLVTAMLRSMTVMVLVAALVTVVMTATLVMIVMFMIIMTAAAVLLVVMVLMLMLMVVTAAAAAVMVVMIMMMVVMTTGAMLVMVMMLLSHQVIGKGVSLLHGSKQLRAGQLVPGGGDDGGILVVLTQQCDSGGQLVLRQLLRAAHDDRAGILNLVFIELAEVLKIDLALGRVRNSDCADQLHFGHLSDHILDSLHNIAQLADAGGLDDDAVGREVVHDLLQSLAEIAHQRTADAAGIHLRDLHAGLLQESAVNADLTKFIFDQDDLLALQRFLQKLFDKCGLSCAQKAGNNTDLCHGKFLFSVYKLKFQTISFRFGHTKPILILLHFIHIARLLTKKGKKSSGSGQLPEDP